MKFLMAGFYHESNTFNPLLTKKEDFIVAEGEELKRCFPGAVKVFADAGVQAVGGLFAGWMSSGVIEEEAYRYFTEKIVDRIVEEGPLDGIWLQLHGAIYAEHIGSGELFLLRKIRKAVGFDIPIAIAMDPHGNLSPDLALYANIVRAYHTAPHTDQQDTYRVTAAALVDLARRRVRVKPAMVRLPMLLCGDTALTREEPLRSVIARFKEMEASGAYSSASFFISMHSANTENTYPMVVLVPRDPEGYQEAVERARDFAMEIYQRRHEFKFEGQLVDPDQAIDMACAFEGGRVVISDSGDNTTAGATGMNTVMLKKFLERGDLGGKKVLISTICDPRACRELSACGIGEEVEVSLGTGVDEYSQPVTVRGVIKSKGRTLVYLPMRFDLRTAADLITLSVGDVDITVCQVADSFTDLDQCSYGGFEPDRYDIIVVKQAYQFPDIVSLAQKQIIALTPGCTCQDLKSLKFAYTKLPWTIFPFEDGEETKGE